MRKMKYTSLREVYNKVLISSPIQIDSRLAKTVIEYYGFDAREFDFTRPNNLLLDIVQKYNLPAVDLLPIFKKHGGISCYFKVDRHWNKLGYEIAAQAIYNKLKSNISWQNKLAIDLRN